MKKQIHAMNLQTRHRQLIHAIAGGEMPKVAGERLHFTPEHLHVIIGSELFRHELKRLKEKKDGTQEIRR